MRPALPAGVGGRSASPLALLPPRPGPDVEADEEPFAPLTRQPPPERLAGCLPDTQRMHVVGRSGLVRRAAHPP
jgi:hypothetical protein